MNYNIIIVRYSEIFLKSEFVRNQLEGKLTDNIRNGIKKKEIDAKVKRERGRIFIETEQLEKITDLLKHVFGISSFSPTIKIGLDNLEKFVKENCKDLLPRKTFAVRVNRIGNHGFSSQELAAKLGEIVINETGKGVKLKNPDDELFVEVKDQNAYIFTEKFNGSSGMPLGSQGRVNCFVDSNEALISCWLIMKRGCVPDIYHITNVEILDNWSYGNSLRRIKVKNVEDIPDNLALVVGDNLEKDGIEKIKEHEKKFTTVLTPVIGLKKEEVNEFWKKIKT